MQKTEEEIDEERKKIENTMSGPWKHLEVVAPAMPDLTDVYLSVKFGQGDKSGSIYARSFYFDTALRKYRYYKSEKPARELKNTKDVAKKAKSLAKCEYEVNTRSNPGMFTWKDKSGKSQVRLSMRFDERSKWPIFVYDEGRLNAETLHGFKAYGEYCKRAQGGEGVAERMLACMSYKREAFAYNRLMQVYEKVSEKIKNSRRVDKVIRSIASAGEECGEMRKQLLRAWASATVGRSGHFRPRSTIRFSLFLRSLAHIRNPTDELVVESADSILKHYEQHRKKANEIFDWEVTEKASRRLRGTSAAAFYEVSPKVTSALSGEVSKEAVGFKFPDQPFQHSQASARLDYEEFKIVVGDDMNSGKVFGRIPVGDISSIVLDDPPRDSSERKQWLKINGRRIRDKIIRKFILGIKVLMVEEEPDYGGSVTYIDPANEFLARSIDSYFTKKTLLELKLLSVRLDEIHKVEEELKTTDVRLRLKIWVGDVFWTATPYTFAKLKNSGLSCNMKQAYRLRIDPEVCKSITLVLFAIDNAVDKLVSPLKSLRHEVQLGFSQIGLDKIGAQNKAHYVPLDNQRFNEEPYMNPSVPKVSLSMELINDVRLLENLVAGQFPCSSAVRKGIQCECFGYVRGGAEAVLSQRPGGVCCAQKVRHRLRLIASRNHWLSSQMASQRQRKRNRQPHK
eukprot:TRINITY_DN14178_c0_g1_i3.p1 TRINITY_DN14178_c0_g1~~TRINITY_DN14178_c0_g1_i3.p1  ORF type:complete len:680 (-),score=171.14 TRINITY_DN14178_c0_g1_i3:641-2680(-)